MNSAICKRFLLISVADPDFQIRVGWGGGKGGGHPDAEPQFSLKIRGGGTLGPSLRSATGSLTRKMCSTQMA